MADDYKKYDTQDELIFHNARLCKDPEVSGEWVRLTVVSTSRVEADSDLWIEANVGGRDVDLAQHLKKGDVLTIKGKPALGRFGENNEKFSFRLRRTDLVCPIALLVQLKERGWVPGAAGAAAKPGKGKPAGKKPAPKAAPQDLDEDE